MLVGTTCFPEDRIVFSLILGLKKVRIWCFFGIRFKVSPKSAVYVHFCHEVYIPGLPNLLVSRITYTWGNLLRTTNVFVT